MKKTNTFLFAVLLLIISLPSKAATVMVNVEDFEFDPSSFTINVGDEVMWMWDNSAGQHTTTSTNIPAGAASWDQEIKSSTPVFSYIATVPGNYDYVCLFHESMGMVGHFTVTGTTGINNASVMPAFSIYHANAVNGELNISYGVTQNSKLDLRIYDITGKTAGTFFSANKIAGTYNEKFPLTGLNRGIYFIRLETSGAIVTKKILIQ